MREDIGVRLKAIRDNLGLSQQRMADTVGLSLKGWQNIELGRNVPNGETLLKIAEQGFSPSWVLLGIAPMHTHTGESSQSLSDSLVYVLSQSHNEKGERLETDVNRLVFDHDTNSNKPRIYSIIKHLLHSIDRVMRDESGATPLPKWFSKPFIDASLMARVTDLTVEMQKNLNITLSSETLSSIISGLYNDLIERVEDINDEEEVEALTAWLKNRLKVRLSKLDRNSLHTGT